MADCAGLRAELDALDAKILAMLSAVSTTAGFDWSVGHVRIDNGSRITSLKSMQDYRKELWSHIQQRCPTEVVETVNHAIDEFGNEVGTREQ